MGFPTTVQEALALTPDEALECVERLEDITEEITANVDWEPPEGLEERSIKFMLAAMIDMLNEINNLPNSPFGPDWKLLLLEEEAQEA